jgi:hypothetical protein
VNDIEIACLRLRCEEAELELTKVEQQRDAAVAVLHGIDKDYVNSPLFARVGISAVNLHDAVLSALEALGAEETT